VITDSKDNPVKTFAAQMAEIAVVWDGRNQRNAMVSDGRYSAALQVLDAQEKVAATFAVPGVLVDKKAPQARLVFPTAGQRVAGLISIQGQATDENLAGWALLLDDQPPLAVGTQPDVGFVLDTRLLTNGTHTLRLVATDLAQQETTAQVQFMVEGGVELPGGGPTTGLPAIPAEVFGVIKGIKGNVEIQRNGIGAWQRAQVSADLYPGDRVRTAANGLVNLLCADGSVLDIGYNTLVVLEKRAELTHPQGEVITARILVGEAKVIVATPTARLELAGPDATVSTGAGIVLLRVEAEKRQIDVMTLGQVVVEDWASSAIFLSEVSIVGGSALLVNRWGSIKVEQWERSTARSDSPPSAAVRINKDDISATWR